MKRKEGIIQFIEITWNILFVLSKEYYSIQENKCKGPVISSSKIKLSCFHIKELNLCVR